MRQRLSEWAPYIGALGIALLVAAGALYVLNMSNRYALIALLVLAVVCFALFVFARPRETRKTLTGRTVVYGSNALLLTLAFVGIVGVADYLILQNYHGRWDVTATQQHTLSPQTIKVLKELKTPVQVTAFVVESGGGHADIEDVLKEYKIQTDKFTYRFVDPETNPVAARDYNIQQDRTIVFEAGKRRENVFTSDESTFTNALLKVTQTEQKAILFTTGHGEHSPTSSDDQGYSSVRGYLQQVNYKVDVVSLATITTSLPVTTGAVIIAGPTKPFGPEESAKLRDYLNGGGHVLMLLDPEVDTGLDSVLSAWGLKLNNDIVLDPKSAFLGQGAIPLITTFPSHDVTKDLNGLFTFFPVARSLSAIGTVTDTIATAILTTSDESWGETDIENLKTNNQAQYDEGKDIKGPLELGYVVEKAADPENGGRLIVLGNAAFLTNGWLRNQNSPGNGILFQNAVHYLAGEKELISIPAKAVDTRTVMISGATDTALILWSSVVFIPLIVLIVGAIVWFRRR